MQAAPSAAIPTTPAETTMPDEQQPDEPQAVAEPVTKLAVAPAAEQQQVEPAAEPAPPPSILPAERPAADLRRDEEEGGTAPRREEQGGTPLRREKEEDEGVPPSDGGSVTGGRLAVLWSEASAAASSIRLLANHNSGSRSRKSSSRSRSRLHAEDASQHDERLVVDWVSAPETGIADGYNLLHRAAYTLEVTAGSPGAEERKVVDRARAQKDTKGWLTTEGVIQFTACDTSEVYLGKIGGSGMRLYFLLLKALSFLFLFVAVLTLPAMISYAGADSLYDEPEAALYKDLAGAAGMGLGNVRASDAQIDAGSSGVLWLGSFTNALVSVCLTVFTLWIGQHMVEVDREVDQQSFTMADYTVKLMPLNDAKWNEFRVSRSQSRAAQECRLKKMVQNATPPTMFSTPSDDVKPAGSKIAEIGSQPAIWVAWDEEESIGLWVKKKALLLQLEAALKVRHETQDEEPVKACLLQIDAINSQLFAQAHDGVPVAVFVSFENDGHYKDAIELNRCRIGLHECKVTPAPEPETLNWAHLQHPAKNRRVRSLLSVVATLVVLGLGVWGITATSALKESNSYTNGCRFVVGPQQNASASHICPGALAEGKYSKAYSKAYDHVHDVVTRADFPRITGAEWRDGRARIGSDSTCAPERVPGQRNVSWPGWTVESDGTASCHRLDSAPSDLFEDGDVDAMCYACVCTLDSVSETRVAALGADYCKRHEDDLAYAQFWFLVSALLVVIINQVLKFSVVLSAGYLKAHTKGEQLLNTMTRIFLCQFTNYVILIIMVKSSVLFFSDIPGDHYDNINAKWHALVAAPMLESLIVQFILIPVEHVFFGSGLVQLALRTLSDTTTQNRLNAANAPLPRDLAVGLGEILLALAVTLIYGPALPLLYWVAAAGFAMRYWVEKWSDLSVYAKPPLISNTLLNNFDGILMILVLLHTAMSSHYVSAAGGLHPAMPRQHSTFGRPHALPMFIAFIFSVWCFGLKTFAQGFSNRLYTLLRALPLGRFFYCNNKPKLLPKFSVAYASIGEVGFDNEDNDYYMDELEDLTELKELFIVALAKEQQERGDKLEERQFYDQLRRTIGLGERSEEMDIANGGSGVELEAVELHDIVGVINSADVVDNVPVPAIVLAVFERVDLNNDGELTRAELIKALRELQASLSLSLAGQCRI